ncbi:MAG: PadR family transcriptional regulator [Gemmatimonadota bacterium]
MSLLSEKAMHGYEVNQELERRDVRDWAGISRPQVYYSLKKLERLKLVSAAGGGGEPAAGPERKVFLATEVGVKALADALERRDWANQRPPPPFLTWLALSWRARPEAVRQMIHTRRSFLRMELDRETATLEEIRRESLTSPAPSLMVDLTIRQFVLELDWLDEVERRLLPPL